MAALCVFLVTDQFNIRQFWPGSDMLKINIKTKKTGKGNIKVKKTKNTQSISHAFNVTFTLLIYLLQSIPPTIIYLCYIKQLTTKYIKIDLQTLLQTVPTNVTRNFFRKRCLKLFPQTLLKIVSQTLFKTVPTNVTQNCFHKRYSELFPQTLHKTVPTNVPQNCFHKSYLKLFPRTFLKIVSIKVT